MINYSIIIPHHNIPDLLKRCLDSIPNRKDIEILIVDDNSSPEIVDFLSFPGIERDDCKIIFDKSGGGAGRARNIALEKAVGKWIIFADADDYFNLCFNDILDRSTNSSADIIYTNITSVDTVYYTINEYICHRIHKMISTFSENDNKSQIPLRYLHTFPWGKIIRRNFIHKHNIRFDETIVANDVTFSYLIGFYASKIAVDLHAMYCYTIRQNSLSKNTSENAKIARAYVMGRANRFYLNHDIPIRRYWQFKQLIFSYFECKDTYKKINRMLRGMGYSSYNIFEGCVCGMLGWVRRKIFKKLL